MAIDYEALLNNPRLQKILGPHQLTEARKDEDFLPNLICERAEPVLSLDWDGGAPGCSGAVWIQRWRGFYFIKSSDYEPEGPFDSVDEALGHDAFSTTTYRPELNSETLPLKTLLEVGMGLINEEGDEIWINRERYVLTGGELVAGDTSESTDNGTNCHDPMRHQLLPPQSATSAPITERPAPTITSIEQKQLVDSGSMDGFFLATNDVCRGLMTLGTDPEEFASVRLLFPFVRNGLVMNINPPEEGADRWLEIGCFAGHDLGLKRPDLIDQVLPRSARAEAERQLMWVVDAARENPTGRLIQDFHALQRRFVQIHDTSKQAELFVRFLLQVWRIGFLAANEPSDAIPELRERFARNWLTPQHYLTVTAWLRSCWRSLGRSVAENMEHPLLKVAREYYVGKPTEEVVLGEFFAEHLATNLLPERESDCSPGGLLDWVRAGLAFGKRFLRERPDMVRRAFDDLGAEESARLVKMIQGTVKQARGVDAARLLGPIIAYTHDYLRAAHPAGPARAAELVIFAADYAVWVPWAMGAAKLAAR